MTTTEFQGNERFVIRRRLGAGGMGVVYEAFDRARNERVALKTLLHADATAIFRFKREFRTLADLVHPNLVALYELHADRGQWFFTMELVDGRPFVRYVRHPPTRPDGPPEQEGLDVPRLRAALRQLAEGVQALHDAGIVHRDIKPSNILVSADGRVRVFDFGIAGEIETQPHDITVETERFGSPHYMAPEQANGSTGTMASDWYAVGVVLYEALTGRLPYPGDNLSVIVQKVQSDPPPPETFAPGAPEDLCDICRLLMTRRVSHRLGGVELLRRLGTDVPAAAVDAAVRARGPQIIVGRDSHRAALDAALEDVRRGQTVSVYVYGPSGWGKSTIVDRFLDGLAGQERTVVLAGRCYDRESMPYKALDGVIDSLSTYLRSLPTDRVEALLPRDVLAIARLFPVLLRVDAIANAPQRDIDLPDPIELRRRAIAALRELLARMADRYALAIYIDDLQWADVDSIALLDDLLKPPDPPPLLLVAAFRSEEVQLRPFLAGLLERADGDSCRALPVGPLADADVRALARSLLRSSASERLLDSIVREAGGSPFLVEQLTEYVRQSDATTATAAIALREMLEARFVRLPAGARALLEVLSVARRPLDAETAFHVADVDGESRVVVAALRAAHMLRSSGAPGQIEVYHDRIRETLAAGLSEESVKRIHLLLATALSQRPDSDPGTLYEHYLGAGARNLAAGQAIEAANRAAVALAFDRAARFYRLALELGPPAGGARGTLQARLGDVLANAGRPAEAADAYLEASIGAPPTALLELRRRAAEQLLFGGHSDRGLQLISELLEAVELKMPATGRQTIARLVVGRLRVRLRGLDYRERAAADIPPADLLRIDTCGDCAVGLSLVDPAQAAYFGTRYLLLALAAGEPTRVARALAMEVGFTASRGGLPNPRTEQLLARSLTLAERLGSPRELGLAYVTGGSSGVLRGQWKKSVELLTRAEQILRERCTGVLWEFTTCQTLLLSSLLYLGEMAEAARRLPLMLGDAQERGNLYAATEARTRANFCWLALDDPDRARREATEALERWSRQGFHRQHNNALIAHVNTDLYNGDAAAARGRVEAAWPILSRTLILRVQVFRVESRYLRARAALAVAAATSRDVYELLRFSEARAAEIAREKMPWSDPFVPLVRGAAAAIRRDTTAAAALLRTAAAGFEAADMAVYAAVSRRRLGQLLKGSDGSRLVTDADAFMTSRGVRRPDRVADVLAPGQWN